VTADTSIGPTLLTPRSSASPVDDAFQGNPILALGVRADDTVTRLPVQVTSDDLERAALIVARATELKRTSANRLR
jgi:hypothetical protein